MKLLDFIINLRDILIRDGICDPEEIEEIIKEAFNLTYHEELQEMLKEIKK